MDLLKMVVKKRSEDKTKTEDATSMGRFSNRVQKLKGEGPMSSSEEPEVTLEVVSINTNDIDIPAHYMRKSVGDLTSLVASIKLHGVQQPIKVIKVKGTRRYRLVFGRRRMAAAKLAGMDAVPCIVELVTKEDRLMMLSLAENINRTELNPLEEGESYKYLSDLSVSKEEICQNLGRSPEYVKDALDMLVLPEPVRVEIINNPRKVSWEMLKVLVWAFQNAKTHAKKLLHEILVGSVQTVNDAKEFLRKL